MDWSYVTCTLFCSPKTAADVRLQLVFVETLGAALMTVPIYADAYAEGDAGGVISQGQSELQELSYKLC